MMKNLYGKTRISDDETKKQEGKNKYDNYYDDVEVIDKAEKSNRKTDSGIALKISLVIFGLLISIAVCVIVLSIV